MCLGGEAVVQFSVMTSIKHVHTALAAAASANKEAGRVVDGLRWCGDFAHWGFIICAVAWHFNNLSALLVVLQLDKAMELASLELGPLRH